MSVPKAQVDEILADFECFIRNAKTLVYSHTPIGLGAHFSRVEKECLADLDACQKRFTRAIRLAQKKHRWGID